MRAAGLGAVGTLVLAVGVALVAETWLAFVVVAVGVVVGAAAVLVGPVARAWRALDLLYVLADRAVWNGSDSVAAEEVAGVVEAVFPDGRGEARRAAWARCVAWRVADEEGS